MTNWRRCAFVCAPLKHLLLCLFTIIERKRAASHSSLLHLAYNTWTLFVVDAGRECSCCAVSSVYYLWVNEMIALVYVAPVLPSAFSAEVSSPFGYRFFFIQHFVLRRRRLFDLICLFYCNRSLSREHRISTTMWCDVRMAWCYSAGARTCETCSTTHFRYIFVHVDECMFRFHKNVVMHQQQQQQRRLQQYQW